MWIEENGVVLSRYIDLPVFKCRTFEGDCTLLFIVPDMDHVIIWWEATFCVARHIVASHPAWCHPKYLLGWVISPFECSDFLL